MLEDEARGEAFFRVAGDSTELALEDGSSYERLSSRHLQERRKLMNS